MSLVLVPVAWAFGRELWLGELGVFEVGIRLSERSINLVPSTRTLPTSSNRSALECRVGAIEE